LDLTIDINELILATYVLAAGVTALSVLMIVLVMMMRSATARRERALRRFETRWSRLFQERPQPPSLPRVRPSEEEWFLIAWNGAQERAAQGGSDAGADRERLNDIARNTGMDAVALRWLAHRNMTRALSAIIMLGYIGDGRPVPPLEKLAVSPDPILSFAAARALVQIHPVWAQQFVELMTERRDWSRFKLLASVEEMSDVLERPILEKLPDAPTETQRELTQYLRFFDPTRSLPVVRDLLKTTPDDMTITSALRVLEEIGERSDAHLASTFAENPDWRIRVQVANVLRARGGQDDLAVLQTLIHDAQWWVRYRAAQAIANIAGNGEQLDDIIRREKDRYAVDILQEVIAEQATQQKEPQTT
jgi:HEAT repeat protein